MEIVFASNNEHKLQEIRQIAGERFKVLSLADIGCDADITEDGDTLEANARIKARYVASRYGRDCFADDTGLEVEAVTAHRVYILQDSPREPVMIRRPIPPCCLKNSRARTTDVHGSAPPYV